MKRLFLDIETIPAEEEKRETLRFLFDKKLEKKTARKSLSEEVIVEEKSPEIQFDEYIRGTSFDGSFGRVLCIAYGVNDDEVRVLVSQKGDAESERKLLKDFWFVAGQCDIFVGHNIMDFDLRFILQRSIILGIEPSWNRFQEFGKKPWEVTKYLSFARYSNIPIFDTMREWVNWSGSGGGSVGLEHLALAMGVPTPKEGIDGSRVAEFFKAGKVDEISEYCKRDVETTRTIYKKMTFQTTLG